jgi:hypothetical protein
MVVGAGLAAPSAVEARHRLAATDIEWLAKYVLATIFNRFDGGHSSIVEPETRPLISAGKQDQTADVIFLNPFLSMSSAVDL